MENILNFPQTTLVDKPVPKNAFWQRADNQVVLKDFLTREFEKITWLYKLAASTLNVEDGSKVHEIAVFHCRMKEDSYSINPFCSMDDLLPRHTMFIIEHGESTDILMQFKEAVESRGKIVWKRDKTELQQNMDLSKLNLRIEGQTMDSVYSSLLGQISGLAIVDTEDYKAQTAELERIAKLKKQIETLERKARAEKQSRKRLELFEQLKELKKQLE